MSIDTVIDGLMSRYRDRVPDVTGIVNAMVSDGLIGAISDIENDHIAFRTMGVPHLGIQSLEKVFLHYGYTRRDRYNFESKKLNAHWYSPPRDDLPRIFISELRVHELSESVQHIIHSYTDTVLSDPVDALDLDNAEQVDAFLHQPLWHTPTWTDYEVLAAESEYASWVIYNRYYLNHFTITIQNLPDGYNTVALFNQFIESHGFTLNDSGGKIKTSPDGKLIQSSTVAQIVNAEFADGHGGAEIHPISGSYVEFAQREVLDDYRDLPASAITRHHRRDGFEASNADKIFESTFTSQTKI